MSHTVDLCCRVIRCGLASCALLTFPLRRSRGWLWQDCGPSRPEQFVVADKTEVALSCPIPASYLASNEDIMTKSQKDGHASTPCLILVVSPSFAHTEREHSRSTVRLTSDIRTGQNTGAVSVESCSIPVVWPNFVRVQNESSDTVQSTSDTHEVLRKLYGVRCLSSLLDINWLGRFYGIYSRNIPEWRTQHCMHQN